MHIWTKNIILFSVWWNEIEVNDLELYFRAIKEPVTLQPSVIWLVFLFGDNIRIKTFS